MSVVIQDPVATPRTAGRRHLRTYLLALVFVALLPTVGAAGVAVWQAASAYRDASSARLLDTARTLARSVENELDTRISTLSTLGAAPDATPHDEGEDLPLWVARVGSRLHGELQRHNAAPTPGNTGHALPEGLLKDAVDTAARESRPVLTDLFFDTAASAPRIGIAVPRTAAGSSGQVLTLVATPQRLVRALQRDPQQHSGLLVAVTDGAGRIVARSHDPDRFVGRRAPDWDKLQALDSDSGIFEAQSADGHEPVIFGFQKLQGTPGWVVVAGESLALFNARWQQPLLAVAGGGALALLLALGLATWLARTILRPLQALAQHAQQLTHDSDGTAAPRPPGAGSAIAEFESLRESLAASEAALRNRTAALAASQRRYRTLAEAGALVLWRGQASGSVVGATGWHELTGQGNDDACGMQWVRKVHRDDLGLLSETRDRLAGGEQLVDLECRVQTAQNDWRWVRVRGAPLRDAHGRVEEWVGVVEDIDERRRAQDRIAHLAHHDAMTGLVNRLRFRAGLDAALLRAGRGEQGAVLCIDLDRFKEVNDSRGHSVGDDLLCQVAERLRALVRETDMVARLGGDEFAVLQSHVGGPDAARQFAARLVAALSSPYDLLGEPALIGASVGIAMVDEPGLDAETLLQRADLALYRAKEAGRGRCCLWEARMTPAAPVSREMSAGR